MEGTPEMERVMRELGFSPFMTNCLVTPALYNAVWDKISALMGERDEAERLLRLSCEIVCGEHVEDNSLAALRKHRSPELADISLAIESASRRLRDERDGTVRAMDRLENAASENVTAQQETISRLRAELEHARRELDGFSTYAARITSLRGNLKRAREEVAALKATVEKKEEMCEIGALFEDKTSKCKHLGYNNYCFHTSKVHAEGVSSMPCNAEHCPLEKENQP